MSTRCYALTMVDIGAAVARAIEFATSTLGPQRTRELRLEEIESSISNDKPVWLITLSNVFDHGPLTGIGHYPTAFGVDNDREYKVFTVAKDTGEVLSMKIRLLAIPSA
jgi:hypothetical protein